MPRFIRSFFGAEQKDMLPVNRYEGSKGDDTVVLSDRHGTAKAKIPTINDDGRQ